MNWNRILIAALVITLGGILLMPELPKNETDPKGGDSGLQLFTDAGTGCQYIGPKHVRNVAPRIAADGRTHMGCGAK